VYDIEVLRYNIKIGFREIVSKNVEIVHDIEGHEFSFDWETFVVVLYTYTHTHTQSKLE
jgi:hypothetical protein